MTGLHEADVSADPFHQFRIWLDEEVHAGLHLPAAMIVATATVTGHPSARAVLLNGFDDRGFVFFTNYASRKARELAENPTAAGLFYWPRSGRQVRVEGTVTRTSPEESDAYFRGRHRDSQIGAWASAQSERIANRETLERRVMELTDEYQGRAVPRPTFWGGYRLVPQTFEFWVSRPNRLHDRLWYTRVVRKWEIHRLAP